MNRRHLARPLKLRGWALFSGGPAAVTLSPGRTGAGWRWAVGTQELIELEPEQRLALPRRSALRAAGEAQLCEQLLAALLLADIDDCDIRFHQGEAPILDGSSGPWLAAIRQAGNRGARRRPPLRVGIRWAGREVRWTQGESPVRDRGLARARTFIGRKEAAGLRRSGAFPGARPGCALVLDDHGQAALYGARPRLQDEPLAHKLLDVLGDLGPWRARGRGSLRVLTDPTLMRAPKGECGVLA